MIGLHSAVKSKLSERLARFKPSSITRFDSQQQSIGDLITYAGMKEYPDYLEIDGSFYQNLYISGYPYVAHAGWLDSLMNFNGNIDISYHIFEVPADVALPKLQRKITQLESTRRTMIRSGKLVRADIGDPLRSATTLYDDIIRGKEKLFQVAIYVCMSGNTLEEISKQTQLLEAALCHPPHIINTQSILELA